MTDIAQWNATHGIAKQVQFINGKGNMPVAEIKNDLGRASIALQGAHVLDFQANGEAPLLWMSEDATFAPGKSLRGGVPICWPWFGPNDSDSNLPGHGPARTANWKPVTTEAMEDGRTLAIFELIESDRTRQSCPHPLRVQLHVKVGHSLSLALETTNLGATSFTLGEALHTYFYVSDVREAKIEGLENCEYIDKIDAGQRKQQHGVVRINSETDRIYLGTGNCCNIVDPVMKRKILIRSEGSASTVVWNPWVEQAEKMGDLGPEGYLHMLCVETANAASNVVQLEAEETHRMVADYSSEPL